MYISWPTFELPEVFFIGLVCLVAGAAINQAAMESLAKWKARKAKG